MLIVNRETNNYYRKGGTSLIAKSRNRHDRHDRHVNPCLPVEYLAYYESKTR